MKTNTKAISSVLLALQYILLF